jgi:copper chaperone NosL
MLAAAACNTPGPRPFAFGSEECTSCHMTLVDPRFAAQLVTTTGKMLPFDDVGCLATFLTTGGVEAGAVQSLWVSDFLRPDSLIAVADAVFLQSDSLRTPMDHRIVALRPGAAAERLQARFGGALLRWADVMQIVGSTSRQ